MKTTLCFFILFTFLPVYAQNNSGEEIDNDDEIILALSILLPIFTGVAGLYVGHYLSENSRRQRQKEELRKIQRLINLDFSRIYHLNKNMKLNHKNMFEDLQKPNAFKQFVINRTTLTNLIRYLKAGLKFYHWNTLENSSSLIKLEPDEIQRIQFAHDQIEGVDKNNEEGWLALANVLETSLTKISEQSKREIFFKTQVMAYFESIFIGYTTIDEAYNQLNIKWSDLDLFLKEYPQEKAKIDKFVSNKKSD